MQTTAIRTVAKSLPQNKVILLTCLISNSYIPYTDLRKKSENCNFFAAFNKYTSNNSNFTPVQTTSKYRGCHIYYNVRPHARKHIIYKNNYKIAEIITICA